MSAVLSVMLCLLLAGGSSAKAPNGPQSSSRPVLFFSGAERREMPETGLFE